MTRELTIGQMWCTDCDDIGEVASRCSCGSARVVTWGSAMAHIAKTAGVEGVNEGKTDDEVIEEMICPPDQLSRFGAPT